MGIDPTFGTHGGVVLRAFTTTLDGELRRLPRGTALSAELTQGWPYSNRRALASTGKVRFTEPEAGAAELMS